MNYSDFPILTDSEYNLLNKHYNKPAFDRKKVVAQICHELNLQQTFCIDKKNRYNSNTTKNIEQAISVCSKLYNNFSSQFNIQSTQISSVSSLSVFSFLKRINKTMSLLNLWIENETKEYYKSLATKSLNELISISSQILQSLEDSFIHFFKHM
ncbi:MAG: hypothetical protein J6Q13_02880 [Clostridia bacterium]|nr:hypothetical protein [Clostridia bacterium]